MERPALVKIAKLIQSASEEDEKALHDVWEDTNIFICNILRVLDYQDRLPDGLVNDLKNCISR